PGRCGEVGRGVAGLKGGLRLERTRRGQGEGGEHDAALDGVHGGLLGCGDSGAGQVSARHQPTNQLGEAINIRLREGTCVGAGEITVGADEVGLELDAGFAALDHRAEDAEDAEDLCSGITTETASAAATSSVKRTASAGRPPSRSMLYIGRSSMRGQLTSKES